jgi:hypothetical protein
MTGVATSNSREDAAPGADGRRGAGLSGRLLGYWLSPAGLVIGCSMLVALFIRAFLLARPHFLTSGAVEYDDGVYLGEAIRLLQGQLPYRDYALIQPPGILLVMLPEAIIAKLTSAATGLALARVATVAASVACVALAGHLVRHRGARVTLVTCGLLAVYPADIMAARTLLLEPWMNLCALAAACLAFRDGKLASPRRLAVAGLVLGFAGTIKFWAVVPAVVLLAACCIRIPPGDDPLLAPSRLPGGGRLSRVRWYLPALAAGFAVPVAALAWAAPLDFARSTLVYQATRVGQSAPLSLRLDHLTGLILALGGHGLGLSPSSYTLFQADATATMEPTTASSAIALAVAVIVAALIAIPYLRAPRARSPLEWFALATAAIAVTAILGYSAFFYHYPAFPAPWLAIAAGAAAGAVPVTSARKAKIAAAAACAAITAVAVLEVIQMTGMVIRGNPSVAGIPPGACVLTDQVSVTIAADRFGSARPGCPDIVDSLAQTLVLSHGVSVEGGAGNRPGVVASWEAIMSQAQYMWLTGGRANRIPWTPQLDAWFNAHFRKIAVFHGYADSRLYQRDS